MGTIFGFHRFSRSAARCGLIVLGVCLGAAGPALALECPAPQKLTGPGVLRETQAQINDTATLLATGDVGNRVPMIVADLRKRYPGVENAEVVNYLMAAYCPIVAALSGLSDAEKQARMDRFVSQLTQFIYSAAGSGRVARLHGRTAG